jgi:hypothetical protein
MDSKKWNFQVIMYAFLRHWLQFPHDISVRSLDREGGDVRPLGRDLQPALEAIMGIGKEPGARISLPSSFCSMTQFPSKAAQPCTQVRRGEGLTTLPMCSPSRN